MKTLFVASIEFKRSRHAPTEQGVGIGSSDSDLKIIVDREGKQVKDIYEWNWTGYNGTMVVCCADPFIKGVVKAE